MSTTKREAAVRLIAAREWLDEEIWCIFCEAARSPHHPEYEPHRADCLWLALADEEKR